MYSIFALYCAGFVNKAHAETKHEKRVQLVNCSQA